MFFLEIKKMQKSLSILFSHEARKRDLIVLKQIVGIMDKEETADSQDI